MAQPAGRVFVVEDDAGIRESLRFLLEEEGYTVAEARDGEAALARWAADPGAWVVLLDRMLPRLDGAGVLRALAASPQMASRLAVIFMSALTDPFDPVTARVVAEQTIAHIGKPFALDTLLPAIERAWRELDHDYETNPEGWRNGQQA